ncbi:MAG: pirin family protein [bacterium]|nr:pirin family protein [bacterium]
MKSRTIKKIFRAKPALEGAGVHLRRGFGYHEVPTFDPFLLFDDFSSSNATDYMPGFPWHPHRGIETVTYILSGEVEHQDSMGNKGSIKKGDVQWMTAGSGIIHQEMPREHKGGIKGFQLWVNLPQEHKMMAPRYQEIVGKTIPLVERGGITVKVIAGEYQGTTGPVSDLMVNPTYLDVSLPRGEKFSYHVPEDYTALLYIIEGDISIGDKSAEAVPAGNIILTESGENIFCTAKTVDSQFLLIAGKPIGESVAWYGPIVMNTEDEIKLALEEYQNGTFVKT